MELPGTVGMILHHKGSHIWSISPSATVFDAIQSMADKNVGAMLVVEDGNLVGLLSERDYTRKVILKGRSSKATAVREIMTRQLVTVTLDDTVEDCMRLVTLRRVRHLPVMDHGRLVGMVSIGDLVKWIIEAQAMTIDQLEKYIVGEYPA